MNGQTIPPGARKILVVDDDEQILRTLSTTLSSNGYYVFLAADGPEAVKVVTQEKPDLILLDVQFPVDAANVGGALQDGFFIMQWLRRMGEAKDVPVIIISGDHSVSCKKRALAAGAVEFFPKPIDNTTLLDIVEKALSKSTHGGPA